MSARCQWCKKLIEWGPDPRQNVAIAYDRAGKAYHVKPCYDHLLSVARAAGGAL